jgi:taurine dioxygenase
MEDMASSQTAARVAAPTLTVRPLGPVMGAEITGIDVRHDMTPAIRDQVWDLFNQHKVLCFRDQDLTVDDLVDFTRHWGEPLEHTMPGQLKPGVRPDVNVASNALPDGKPSGKHPDFTAMRWHTDRSWRPRPALATLLYGSEVPSVGGDTLYANTALAYEALPAEMKQRLDGMKIIHSVEYSRRAAGGFPATEYEKKNFPPVAHPVARTHPVTGKKSIYAGSHAWKMDGMSEDEGRRMVDELTKFATQDQFVYRHKWRRHDLVMWDNRCTFHAATPYDTAREIRTMFRTVVEGDVPV